MKSKRITILLLTIYLNALLSCSSNDKRMKFKNCKQYVEFVDSCINKDIAAFKNSTMFINDKQFCQKWADSLKKISKNNNYTLSQIQPYRGDSSLTEAAKTLNSFFLDLSQFELPDYINLVFSNHSDNGWEIEINLQKSKNKINQDFEVEYNRYSTMKQTQLAKHKCEH